MRFPRTIKVDERMSAGRIIGGAFTPFGILDIVVTNLGPIVALARMFEFVSSFLTLVRP